MRAGYVARPAEASSDHAATLTLDDGRTLAWIECGDPDGKPVMFLHGTPDSRFGCLAFHEIAQQAGLRVISPDRPGYGKSTFKPNRTLDSWSDDARQLLNHLGIDKVLVWGISGGGAYCCVMARDLPDRVSGVLSVCGMLPPTPEEHGRSKLFIKIGVFFARLPAWLANPLFRAIYRSMCKSNTPKARDRMLKQLPESSRDDALKCNLFYFMALSGETNLRAGPEGVRQEMQLYSGDASQFRIGPITPPFTLMHGETDVNVPVAIARRVEAAIPHAKAIYYPGEAHTFWWPNRQRMIDEIAALARASSVSDA